MFKWNKNEKYVSFLGALISYKYILKDIYKVVWHNFTNKKLHYSLLNG